MKTHIMILFVCTGSKKLDTFHVTFRQSPTATEVMSETSGKYASLSIQRFFPVFHANHGRVVAVLIRACSPLIRSPASDEPLAILAEGTRIGCPQSRMDDGIALDLPFVGKDGS